MHKAMRKVFIIYRNAKPGVDNYGDRRTETYQRQTENACGNGQNADTKRKVISG